MGASFERVDTNEPLAATVTIYVVMYPLKGLVRAAPLEQVCSGVECTIKSSA